MDGGQFPHVALADEDLGVVEIAAGWGISLQGGPACALLDDDVIRDAGRVLGGDLERGTLARPGKGVFQGGHAG